MNTLRTHFPSASAHTNSSLPNTPPPHIIPAPTHNHCCSSIHRAHPTLHRTNIIPHAHAHPRTYISCRPQINTRPAAFRPRTTHARTQIAHHIKILDPHAYMLPAQYSPTDRASSSSYRTNKYCASIHRPDPPGPSIHVLVAAAPLSLSNANVCNTNETNEPQYNTNHITRAHITSYVCVCTPTHALTNRIRLLQMRLPL